MVALQIQVWLSLRGPPFAAKLSPADSLDHDVADGVNGVHRAVIHLHHRLMHSVS